MKINLEDINPEKTLQLTGYEPWLEGIYSSFPTPKGKDRPLLTGFIKLHNVADGMAIEATGRLKYQPYVDCSRCADPITWDINTEVSGRFVPPTQHEPSEREEILTESKAASYEIDLDETINLEPLVNDRIQLEVPIQTVKKSDDLETCRICGKSVADEKVYAEGEQNPERDNPFAVLKELKVKH